MLFNSLIIDATSPTPVLASHDDRYVAEHGHPQLVVVATKAYKTSEATETLLHVLGPETTVLTLQNGAGNVETLSAVTTPRNLPLIAGATSHGATMLAPGLVRHAGKGWTAIGAASPCTTGEHVRRVSDFLNSIGIETHSNMKADAARTIVWRKLLVNACINPITAVLGCNNGKLLEDPRLISLMQAVFEESCAVAVALGVDFGDMSFRTVANVAEKTAPNVSSMLADVRRHVPTEIDAINGYIAEQGTRVGVDTPLNTYMAALVKDVERQGIHVAVSTMLSGTAVGRSRRTPHAKASPGSIAGRRASARSLHTSAKSYADGEDTLRLHSFGDSSMVVADSVGSFREYRRSALHDGLVGFVPTMGALHEGHLSLVKLARKHCDHVVSSIFVNPAQFAANEDLSTYPRTLESDLDKLCAAGVDAVVVPPVEQMYPEAGNFSVVATGSELLAEGRRRPHFFHGVATVVTKLLNIAEPDVIVMGQKDAQQCAVIRQLVRSFLFPTEVVIGATQREPNGLAMSSRNVYLSPQHRIQAAILYAALKAMRQAYLGGETSVSALLDIGRSTIATEPDFAIEYLVVADALTMKEYGEQDSLAPVTAEEVARVDHTHKQGEILNAKYCFAVATKVGATRLIDNVMI